MRFLEPLEESARLSLLETDRARAMDEISSLLASANDEEARYETASFLGKFDHTNKQAISALSELLQAVQTERLRLKVAGSLVQLGCTSSEIEQSLLNTLKSKKSDWYRRDAARYLLQIDSKHSEAISTLIELFCNSGDEIFRWNLDIEEISEENLSVSKALLKVFFTKQDITHRRQAGVYLWRIVAKQFSMLERLLSLIKIQKKLLSIFNVAAKQEKSGIFHLKKNSSSH